MFADGISWTRELIMQKLLDQESAATGGSIWGYGGRNDVLVAGLGDKFMAGQGGNDTYVYSSAGGNDIVAASDNQQATLQFSDIASTGVTMSRPNGGANLVLTVLATGKTVTVQGEYANGGQLKQITFSDGVTWSYAQVQQMLLDQESAANGGSIWGYGGRDDVLVAGLGNKFMAGQGGNDTYVYSSAGGNDIIADSDNFHSTLQFTDIASTGVAMSRPNGGADLVLTVLATGKTVTVQREFANGGPLKQITFSDGVSWSQQDVLNRLAAGPIFGTPGNETVTGTSHADIIDGIAGNDTLVGGGGYDTYRISNMGQVVVNNVASDGVTTANGEVDFGAGITDQQLWFVRVGNDLQIDQIGTTNHVTMQGWYGANPRAQVQSFGTADGMKLDSQIAQLVSAMATYSAANPGFDPTSTSVHTVPNDTSLQNSLAAAWHS
jgi:hypothetical protein